jgi:hypothetical protein
VKDLILEGIFPNEWKDEEWIPLDFKVGIWHPYFPKEYKIIIWFHSNMPHVIKKFVNCLENSGMPDSKRNLHLRGMPLSLKMLEKMWRRSRIEGALRTSKLSEECFIKDAASRMHCYLAFHITSEGMVRVNNQYCTEDEKKQYEPLNGMLLLLDKLIDIINAKRQKGYEGIDLPTHPYLDHLLMIVKVFTKWKSETVDDYQFVPMSTYQDLCWVCFSTIGLAKTYLIDNPDDNFVQNENMNLGGNENESREADNLNESGNHEADDENREDSNPLKAQRVLAQDRLGSDVCEHRFCGA